VTLHLGDLLTRTSNFEAAHATLSEAADLAEAIEKTKEGVTMDLAFFGLHGKQELWSDAFRTIVRAEGRLKRLLETDFVQGLERGAAGDLVERFASLRFSMGSPTRPVATKSSAVVKRKGRATVNGTHFCYGVG
jgi:hypothetical protein